MKNSIYNISIHAFEHRVLDALCQKRQHDIPLTRNIVFDFIESDKVSPVLYLN